MKKIKSLCLLVILIITVSCSGSKELRDTESAFNGSWKLEGITSRGINPNYIEANIFGVGSAECFINSTWAFVSNNHSGTVQLVSGNKCGVPSQQQNISWHAVVDSEINERKFLFKIIPNNMKAEDVADGYELDIQSLGEYQIVLYQTVPFEGSTVDLVYTFNKMNQSN